jgi:hypothetical protein
MEVSFHAFVFQCEGNGILLSSWRNASSLQNFLRFKVPSLLKLQKSEFVITFRICNDIFL